MARPQVPLAKAGEPTAKGFELEDLALPEQRLHNNCVELITGFFALKSFSRDRACAHVHLLMDNVSAVSYINKMGGTHSHLLSNLAVSFWEWCLPNHLIVSAQHLPGALNIRANWESTVMIDSNHWKLKPSLFQALRVTWGYLEIDLFDSRLPFQILQFVSWTPDPLATFADAFYLNWSIFWVMPFPRLP